MRKIPNDFDKQTMDSIRKAKQKAIREFSPTAGPLMVSNARELNSKFNLKPANTQVCKRHRQMPIEFFNPIQNEFCCKICASQMTDQKLVPLYKAASEFQDQLFSLKHQYLKKKTHVIDRLKSHIDSMEDYFRMFYEVIDKQRKMFLAQEYEMKSQMDNLEVEMSRLLYCT